MAPNEAGHIATGIKGEYGTGLSASPVTLWVPADDSGGSVLVGDRELVEGSGSRKITILSGTPVVAIDGETQVTALHELYDDPESYGLTYAQLRAVSVPFELYWELEVEDARQVFYDRNVKGVPVAKNLAMSMDQRDLGTQLAHRIAEGLTVEHQGARVQFSKLVQAPARQERSGGHYLVRTSGTGGHHAVRA